MQYNIHPIVVHIPIALLGSYSLITIVPVRRWLPQVAWDNIALFLLVGGVLGAFAALETGETAAHLTGPNRAIASMHARFARAATALYVTLLAGALAQSFNRSPLAATPAFGAVRRVEAVIERLFTKKVVTGALAVLALIALLFTGLLGGAMVYGTTADPFAADVLSLLGLSL